jgi:hypothetical protein
MGQPDSGPSAAGDWRAGTRDAGLSQAITMDSSGRREKERAPEVQAADAGMACPDGPPRRLPPGQYIPAALPVLHYGPVPAFNPGTWDLCVFGATRGRTDQRWTQREIASLPRRRVVADFHA